MKFATKLTAIVVMVFAIAVPALGASIYYLTRNIIQQNIIADQLRQTRSILNNIDRSLHDAYQDIDLIGKASDIEVIMELADQSQYTADLSNIINLTGPWELVSIVDISGNIIYSSQNQNVGKNIKLYAEARAAHYAALAGRRYYSDFIESSLITRPTIIFSAPIIEKDSRKILGSVVGHYAWPIILQLLDGTHSSNQIQLFNRDGVVIATPSEQRDAILKTSLGKNNVVQQLFAGERLSSGIDILDDKQGPILATAISQEGYLGYQGNDWGLLLGVPTNIAYAAVVPLAGNITVIILGVMTLIVIIVYLLAKRITKPVEILKNAAAEFGAGNYDYPIDIKSGDEIEDLSHRFVQMAQSRKQAEKELRDAQFKIVRQERLATLGQLSATVSHELRNPLGAMRFALPTLKKYLPADDERVTRAYDRLDRSIDRCVQIIEEMLDFTRIDTTQRKRLVFDQWLSTELDDLRVPDGVKVRRDFQLDQREVYFNPDQLRRAFINVYNNACDSMLLHNDKDQPPENKLLTVKTKINNKKVEVVIADTGPGIPDEVLEHIFEPLFSTKSFGVGLGLPTVKKIMEQHGGGVEIYTEKNRGTQIVLWLPDSRETQ